MANIIPFPEESKTKMEEQGKAKATKKKKETNDFLLKI